MKTILSLLAIAGISTVTVADDADTALSKEIARYGCNVTARGEILYNQEGTYRQVRATLAGVGASCTTLSVGGTDNKIDRLSVKALKSGRNLLTMLFNNPPAVGNGESVLLEGSVIRHGSDATYYGDIYQRQLKEPACAEGRWHSNRDCWEYKGGFYFSTK